MIPALALRVTVCSALVAEARDGLEALDLAGCEIPFDTRAGAGVVAMLRDHSVMRGDCDILGCVDSFECCGPLLRARLVADLHDNEARSLLEDVADGAAKLSVSFWPFRSRHDGGVRKVEAFLVREVTVSRDRVVEPLTGPCGPLALVDLDESARARGLRALRLADRIVSERTGRVVGSVGW